MTVINMEVNKHCHREGNTEVDKRARRKLITASVLCVIFMVERNYRWMDFKQFGNSLRCSSFAHRFCQLHDISILPYIATRPSTKKMSFGWYRAEVIGALTSVLMIWVVTGILVYMAVQRILHKTYEIDAEVMLITSGVGVIVNLMREGENYKFKINFIHLKQHPGSLDLIIVLLDFQEIDHKYFHQRMGMTLHQHGHSHAGGSGDNHSHKKQNINVRAAFIHVLGDFLQSFGVFVAALVIYFKRDLMIVDPICTFIFSVLVLITTFAIIKDALLVLMEALPKGIDFEDVMNILLNIEGVMRVHNLRIWALSLDKIAMSAHVAIRPGTNPQNVLMVATKNIHDKYNFFEMTLQIEEFQEIMEECKQCKNPS
ncbi:hypothetical protein NQ318_012899 [Aromia moschata]|uniref:Zinc transporter 2 n=1 Tax=Aromia moschata TaxID=1265417 RepID=A0AAV8YBZ0_9CUCU|nr:hypothetical protein NQ318_012899 [Aromia moschata]